MTSSEEWRRRLVDDFVRAGVLRSPELHAAFHTVPRERFVPELAALRGLDAVYVDEALVVAERHGMPTSSSSQPSMMADMLEALEVRPGHRVLEVGLGTGYNAAILARVVGSAGSVTSVDIDVELVARADAALAAGGYPVTTAVGDGRLGWPSGAPYDRIIVTASTATVPRAWREQLTADGRLIAPLRLGAMQVIAVFARTPTGFRSTRLIPGGFIPLRDQSDQGDQGDQGDGAGHGEPGAERAAPADVEATVGVRADVPGLPPVNVSATGPGVTQLSAEARRAFVGHLLEPPRRHPVGPYPAWAVVWHAVLTGDPRRQILVYGPDVGMRFGLVTPTGAASVLVATACDGVWPVDAVESYGPAADARAQLLRHLDVWTAAGSPPFDRLTITVDYLPATPPPWALRTFPTPDHLISAGWPDPR